MANELHHICQTPSVMNAGTTVRHTRPESTASERPCRLVVFALDELRYALPLNSVMRVVAMMATTPIPRAPEVVLGLIHLEGEVIPAVSIRQRFHLRQRSAELSDHLLIVNTGRRRLALWVDDVLGIIERAVHEIIPSEALLPGLQHLKGVTCLPDGLVLIQDLDSCLSLEEENRLEVAILENRPDSPRA